MDVELNRDKMDEETDPIVLAAVIINEKLGTKIQDIKIARNAAVELEEAKVALRRSLLPGDDMTGTPHKVASSISVATSSLNRLHKLISRRDDMIESGQSHVQLCQQLVDEYLPTTSEVTQLEKRVKYLRIIDLIENLSLKIQTALDATLSSKAVGEFETLADLCKMAKTSKCQHMKGYLMQTTQFWYTVLKNKFALEFNDVLKVMKWPLISPVPGKFPTPSYEVLARFEKVFCLLLDIQIQGVIKEGHSSENLSTESHQTLLPLHLLFLPFRKRFLYHFSGNKKTNSITKPEWYFTQALLWMRTHISFLDQYVQPILNRTGRSTVITKVELIQNLTDLIVVKLQADVGKAIQDDTLLAHIINETLSFEKELKNIGFPGGQSTCFQVLTQDSCFTRWLHMEKNMAQATLDKVLSSKTAWSLNYFDQSDEDNYKVPECTEKFLMMIQSITDRYKLLPQPGHRLQFLNLQLDLIDEFRVRLRQLLETKDNPIASNCCSILNSVYYVTHVLQDWCDLPFFLQMQYYRLQFMAKHHKMQAELAVGADTLKDLTRSGSFEQLNFGGVTKSHRNSPLVSAIHKDVLESIREGVDEDALNSLEGSVFEDGLELYNRMKDELIAKLTKYVLKEAKSRSYLYENEKWFAIPGPKEFIAPTLSASACSMLMFISASLRNLKEALAVPLFNAIWPKVAEQLDDFFYHGIIRKNLFSEGGALQLHFDVTRNLFPVFAEYTRRPENHFKRTKESCILLTSKMGSALLLKDMLEQERNCTDTDSSATAVTGVAALEEIGVNTLTCDEALDVIGRRTDIKAL